MQYKKALIVDDSKLARITLKKKLEQRHMEVVMAESAREALEYLAGNGVDIVFMDHLMPEMDGFQATQQIKSNPATAHIPVIMCSGKENEGYLEEAQAIGASGILPKPPENDALDAALSAAGASLTGPTIVASPVPASVGTPGLTESDVARIVDEILAGQLVQQREALAEELSQFHQRWVAEFGGSIDRRLDDLGGFAPRVSHLETQIGAVEQHVHGLDQGLRDLVQRLDGQQHALSAAPDEGRMTQVIEGLLAERLLGIESRVVTPDEGILGRLARLEDTASVLSEQLQQAQTGLSALAGEPAARVDGQQLASELKNSLQPALQDMVERQIAELSDKVNQDVQDQIELQLSYKLNELRPVTTDVGSEVSGDTVAEQVRALLNAEIPVRFEQLRADIKSQRDSQKSSFDLDTEFNRLKDECLLAVRAVAAEAPETAPIAELHAVSGVDADALKLELQQQFRDESAELRQTVKRLTVMLVLSTGIAVVSLLANILR